VSIVRVVPDGDRFHHAAAALRPALVGRPLRGYVAGGLEGPMPRLGRVVESIEVNGRRVLIRFDDDLIIDSQFRSPYLAVVGRRSSGLWHLYREGQFLPYSQQDVSVALTVDGWTAACVQPLTVESYRAPDSRRHPSLGGQGPDISRPDADLSRVLHALLLYPDPETSMAEVLGDQRVFNGVGNVYRSEVLWANRLNPDALVGSLPRRDLMTLVNSATGLLTASLDRVVRRGTESPFAVYGRNGQACPRCHDTITVVLIGAAEHELYWCRGCQTRHDPVREGLRSRPLTQEEQRFG
jgi:endonuclease-8